MTKRKKKNKKWLCDKESIDQFLPTTNDRVFIYFVIATITSKNRLGNSVKIGISKNVGRRITCLQVGCPFPIELWYSFEVDAISAERLEHKLHGIFNQTHMQGEWFKVDKNIVRWVNWHKEMIALQKKRKKTRVINRTREEREHYDHSLDPRYMQEKRAWPGL